MSSFSLKMTVGSSMAMLMMMLLFSCSTSCAEAFLPLAPTRRTPTHHATSLQAIHSRRAVFPVLLIAGAAAPVVNALDMDAFANSELEKSKVESKMSDDEALCRFGQPSKGRGDACVRAGISTELQKGGVNAYGKVDRGDYVKCKPYYEIVGDKYEKKMACSN